MTEQPDYAKKLLQNADKSSVEGGMQGTVGHGNLQSQGNYNTFITSVAKIKGQTPVVRVYKIVKDINLGYGFDKDKIYPCVGELYEKDAKFRSLVDAINAYEWWEDLTIKIKRTSLIVVGTILLIIHFTLFSAIDKNSKQSEVFSFLDSHSIGLFDHVYNTLHSQPKEEISAVRDSSLGGIMFFTFLFVVFSYLPSYDKMSYQLKKSLEKYILEVLFSKEEK
jgi:hypothetical protein